jgi:hypothetical protein
MSRGVQVEVGELVLTGFGQAEGERVAASLKLELERLCAAGVEAGGSTLLHGLLAEPIAIGPHIEPERIGANAARSIHRSLGG